MSEALRYEIVRLRTLRSSYWLFASGLALSALASLLFAYGSRTLPLTPRIVADVAAAGGASLPLPLLAAFVAAVGILATGHDYRYGTIQPTLTAMPQRTPLVAKVLVVGAMAVLIAVASLALNLAAGILVWHRFPDLTEPPLGQILTGYVLLTLLWSVVGVALGQLFRGVPGPLVVILAVPDAGRAGDPAAAVRPVVRLGRSVRQVSAIHRGHAAGDFRGRGVRRHRLRGAHARPLGRRAPCSPSSPPFRWPRR